MARGVGGVGLRDGWQAIRIEPKNALDIKYLLGGISPMVKGDIPYDA
jgi:hypothetical protein